MTSATLPSASIPRRKRTTHTLCQALSYRQNSALPESIEQGQALTLEPWVWGKGYCRETGSDVSMRPWRRAGTLAEGQVGSVEFPGITSLAGVHFFHTESQILREIPT